MHINTYARTYAHAQVGLAKGAQLNGDAIKHISNYVRGCGQFFVRIFPMHGFFSDDPGVCVYVCVPTNCTERV